MERVERNLKASVRVELDPEALRWTPILGHHSSDLLFRSPARRLSGCASPPNSPISTPTSSQKKKKKARLKDLSTSTSSEDEDDQVLSKRKKKMNGNNNKEDKKKSAKKNRRGSGARRNLTASVPGECEGLDGGALIKAAKKVSDREDTKNQRKINNSSTTSSESKKGQDVHGGEIELSHEGSSRKKKPLKKKWSQSTSTDQDEDADDEGEDLPEATKKSSIPPRLNKKTQQLSDPKVVPKRKVGRPPKKRNLVNNSDIAENVKAAVFGGRRAALIKASNRISKDSRRSMSISSDDDDDSEHLSSVSDSEEDAKSKPGKKAKAASKNPAKKVLTPAAKDTKSMPNSTLKRKREESGGKELTAKKRKVVPPAEEKVTKPGGVGLSWPEQLARIKQRNAAGSRESVDSVDGGAGSHKDQKQVVTPKIAMDSMNGDKEEEPKKNNQLPKSQHADHQRYEESMTKII